MPRVKKMSNAWTLRVVITTLASLLAPCNFFCTTYILKGVYNVLKPLKNRLTDTEHRSAVITMIYTGSSSACFTLANLTYIIGELNRLSNIDRDINGKDVFRSERAGTITRGFRSIALVFQMSGYLLTLNVCVFRMKSVFRGTAFMMSDRATKVICWTVLATMSLVLMWVVLYAMGKGDTLASILALITSIPYFTLSTWVSWKFISNTRSLVEYSGSDSLTKDLLDVSLKLSILSVSSISSTVLLNIINVAMSFPRTVLGNAIMDIAFQSDAVYNNYCLLCTLRSSVHFYQAVFGPIHGYLMDKLMPSEKPTNNQASRVEASVSPKSTE